MKEDRLFLSLAFIAFFIAVLATILTYSSVVNVIDRITGYQTGEANLTIATQAEINFTTRAISWGSGKVNSGSTSASLTTFGSNNVTGGNWTLTTSGGLRIVNIGNVNVTLNLTVAKTPDSFIGGTSPIYRWNLTAVEANSCINITGGTGVSPRMNSFFNASPAAVDNLFCDRFRFEAGNDEVRLDFNLTIPEDAVTGARGDIITATATAI